MEFLPITAVRRVRQKTLVELLYVLFWGRNIAWKYGKTVNGFCRVLHDSAKDCVVYVSMLMHVFVVALTAEMTSPPQRRGLPRKEEFRSTPRVTHGTHRTRTRGTRNTAVHCSGTIFT